MRRICPICQVELNPHHARGRPPTYHPDCKPPRTERTTERICGICRQTYTLQRFNEAGSICPACRDVGSRCHYCGQPLRDGPRKSRLLDKYCDTECQAADWPPNLRPVCAYPGCPTPTNLHGAGTALRGPYKYCDEHQKLMQRVRKQVHTATLNLRMGPNNLRSTDPAEYKRKYDAAIRKALRQAGFRIIGRPQAK